MYEQGLNDTWECIRKFRNLSEKERDKIFDTIWLQDILCHFKPLEFVQKIEEYEKRRKIENFANVTGYDIKEVGEAVDKIEKQLDQKQDEKLCDRCKNSKLCELNYLKYVNTCSDFCPKTDATDMNDGSIKVGDEVRIKGSDPVKDDCDYGICTRSLPNINTIYVMRRDGSSGEENKDEWYRTGRHFPQITEVLKAIMR